jgi:hypothetical protein
MDSHAHADDPVHFALIGDIVSSRDLPDRAGVQRRLQAELRRLNDELGPALTAPLKLTAGDEVQGLLGPPERVVDILLAVAEGLHPARLVWGLGRGTLDTDLSDDVSVLDGPCLHRARDAVEAAKSGGRWLVTRGLPEPHGRVLEALMDLLAAIRSGWTETRARYVREARGRQQQEVAARLGVSKQAVHQALAAAHFAPVLEAEAAARDLLEWLGGPDRVPAGGVAR